ERAPEADRPRPADAQRRPHHGAGRLAVLRQHPRRHALRERMIVKELTARHVRIPLRKPIKHASHSRTETDNVLVRCVLDDGTAGFGEGVPREYVTGGSIDSTLELLSHSDLADQL